MVNLAMLKSAPRRAEQAFYLVKKGRALLRSRPREKRVVFVAGVQRSGTTLLLRIFDRSWQTHVFHEHYANAYESNSLRDVGTLRKLVSQSGAPFVIFKALNDSFRLTDLQGQFAHAKVIWVFRQYDDVVNSNLRKWPRGRNKIDEIVVDPASGGGWRGQRMSGDTLETLRQLYKPEINNASAQALFWYYRNRLLFEQYLQLDNNILLLNYDAFVTRVDSEAKRLELFTDVPISQHMLSIINSESVGKHDKPDILPDIRVICDQMYRSLLAACDKQRQAANFKQ